MLAGVCVCRAAGVKLGHRLADRETSELEIFKRTSRYGWDLFPARDWRPRVAERPVSRIVSALEFKHLQR